MTEYTLDFIEWRDGIDEMWEDGVLVGYCSESKVYNPHHLRAGFIEINEATAPVEFKEGKITKFRNNRIGLCVEAQLVGESCNFVVYLDMAPNNKVKVQTSGNNYATLPDSILNGIKVKDYKLSDINDITIGYKRE